MKVFLNYKSCLVVFLIRQFTLSLAASYSSSELAKSEEASFNSNGSYDIKKRCIFINAANSDFNWGTVDAYLDNGIEKYSIQELVLENFGQIMQDDSFQAALEHSEPQLRSVFASQSTSIDAVIVASKGVNVLTYLASNNLWNGPSLLLSPIPNACNHIQGGSWENEWESTVDALLSHGVGPIVIGAGTSSDEQMFIVNMIYDEKNCGSLAKGKSSGDKREFKRCPNWFVYSFPG
eukprot:CAMPEP_0194436294 /NCGR_PEP_ID=MMETSP0176-20130528/93797_1 /TAXON_ID=216777 /ORGANISM="Proboscia alata, Strain PI-D3" /LENGTH=234 /DNA_ID=CAMNT_0039256481 /DNA_START=71 /DNA_END=771 /DNA_ORIENTATION=+